VILDVLVTFLTNSKRAATLTSGPMELRIIRTNSNSVGSTASVPAVLVATSSDQADLEVGMSVRADPGSWGLPHYATLGMLLDLTSSCDLSLHNKK
jgi:hypothetical protein